MSKPQRSAIDQVASIAQTGSAVVLLVWLPLQADRLQTAIRLPVERASNVFFARATINGIGPFWFTVDTGATLTVIDPGAAKLAGLVVRGARPRSNVGISADDVAVATTSGARIEVGGAPPFAPPQLFVVAVRGNAGYLGHAVDGVLGTDFLSRHVVEFSYGESRVTLQPSSAPVKRAATSVPLTTDRNRVSATATLTLPDGDQVAARLLIDTGSNGALTLTSPFVRRHRLTTRFPSRQRSATVGINGIDFSPVVQLRSVAFGSTVLGTPNAALSQAAAGLNASEDFDGILGGELLRRFTVTVDYPGQRLILDDSADAPRLLALPNQTLQSHIEEITGPNAVDCGRLGIQATAEAMAAALACALDAARLARAFQVVKSQQGIDSVVAHGLFAKAGGPILMFSYDSDPSGGSGARESFTTESCRSPTVVTEPHGSSFKCVK